MPEKKQCERCEGRGYYVSADERARCTIAAPMTIVMDIASDDYKAKDTRIREEYFRDTGENPCVLCGGVGWVEHPEESWWPDTACRCQNEKGK
ncbi:MAG: hypothetical protein V3W37_09995 [Candidatus Binatia bacterium]